MDLEHGLLLLFIGMVLSVVVLYVLINADRWIQDLEKDDDTDNRFGL